ncbi:MAG TPA: CUAEP/CCAEP-tail radical SAM protein [Candidatus Dormibacteraeota bacterium]|nr:CUAEP/CCAEP-tail radical SAM protein [Candidatus Dormibacteraeota bacterium]
MKIVLISTYELGRQPFGLASPAAWLRAGGSEVLCVDLSRAPFREEAIRGATLVAFYVPMHTATRLAVELLKTIRELNPDAHICFYGLYAPMNESWLRALGVQTILGGEFEQGLTDLAGRILDGGATHPQSEPVISLARQKFAVPDRTGLVALDQYAQLALPNGEKRTVGYTEASRGCKHLCRHCPIVPVYKGVFRVVDRDVVLADICQQIAAGAQHITFGDPDFFNGIGHAIPLVEAVHNEFPQITYDATIKIEHLLKHSEFLPMLRQTGCLFVTSAVESVDDLVLEKLDKHHTRADFLDVVRRFQEIGLTLQPTFLPFTPWTSLESYIELLEVLRENGLVENVAPIQLAIRLLIPAGSRLLELSEVRALVAPFDESAMVYPWKHSDHRVDTLSQELQQIVHAGEKLNQSRSRIFERIETSARRAAGASALPKQPPMISRATIPYLTEPWYC